MPVTVTIHRGTHQIGGCATEIVSGDNRIFIDMGSKLPGENGVQPVETMSIPGITEGEARCDGVFFTHTHGDHIGQLERILPDVPLYMGATAKELSLILNRYLAAKNIDRAKTIAALEQANIFELVNNDPQVVKCGRIKVTPYFIDHSAFDAYMFLIEAEGVRILHTGDFRLHGFRGSKTIPMLKKYVGQVDWLICEGTLIGCDGRAALSEHELQLKAKSIMQQHKRVFVLCSSMNIDRIAGFIHAIPDGRPVICDDLQKKLLECVQQRHGDKTPLYRFGKLLTNKNKILHDLIEEQGCLAFIRDNYEFRQLLDWFDDSYIVYSMWDGYISGNTANQRLVKFLEGRAKEELHTSGHATTAAIREVYDTVSPRKGVIPIHTEAPERFCELLNGANVVLLDDGQELKL